MGFRTSSTTAALGTIVSILALTFACGRSSDATNGTTGSGRDGNSGASPDGTNGANGDGAAKGRPTDTDGGKPPVIAPDAGPPAVRFIGRFDTRNPAAPSCAWPGCRIVANFMGSEVKARLEEHVESWMEGGPSEWDVIVDGVLQPKLVLELGAHDYILASGLGAGPHSIELYKRTESQNGYTDFLGYDFGDGSLLPPPLPATRRIEFVGDSGPAGFGIEGVGQGPDCPGPDWAARWQNFHKSMGARLSEMLGAELHGTIYSGKGLVRDIWRDDPDTMPVIYARANPLDRASVFDFSTFVPDVFVVMMGGNDFALGQPVDNGPSSLPEFTQATRDLVSIFHSRNPQAHVFLALSPSVSDVEPPGRDSRTNVKAAFDTVANERAAAGDKHVHSVAPPVAAPSELTGCNGHGTPAYHERVAQQLAVFVKSATGWQ